MSDDNNAGVMEVSDASFAREVYEAGLPVLVDFGAEWCPPCKMMNPIIAQLAPEYAGRVKFARIDTDDNPETAAALGVMNLPTFLLFHGETVLASRIGSMRPATLRDWIAQGLAKVSAPVQAG